MATDQLVGSLQYDRPNTTVTTSATLASEYRFVNSTEANQAIIEQWLSLDPATVAQVTTITITGGSDGDFYDVEVDDGTTNEAYSYRQKTGQLASDIATGLAENLDRHPGITAEAAGNVITATGVVPGISISFDESNSTTPGNVATLDTTTASGTALTRLISSTTINWSTDTSGYPKVNYQTIFYDGSDPAVVGNNGPVFDAKGSTNLDTIQTNNGVARAA